MRGFTDLKEVRVKLDWDYARGAFIANVVSLQFLPNVSISSPYGIDTVESDSALVAHGPIRTCGSTGGLRQDCSSDHRGGLPLGHRAIQP